MIPDDPMSPRDAELFGIGIVALLILFVIAGILFFNPGPRTVAAPGEPGAITKEALHDYAGGMVPYAFGRLPQDKRPVQGYDYGLVCRAVCPFKLSILRARREHRI